MKIGKVVRLAYEDDDLRLLATKSDFHLKQYGRDVERGYRKAIGLLTSASSQMELRQFKGLRLEKVDHDFPGCHSVRINGQWRLIIEFAKQDDDQIIIVIKITDYH